MHTVLVHPDNMSSVFQELPTLDEHMKKAPYPVVQNTDQDHMVWCPQSTSMRYPESISVADNKSYKHFDHLAFAFLVPDGTDGIDIPSEILIQNLVVNNISTTDKSPAKAESKVNRYDAIRYYFT